MPWEKSFDVETILERAMHAFWARGYEATSMRELVEQTGVNRASLYATYGDKHDLFVAALRRYDERMRCMLEAGIAAGQDPRAAIRGVFETFMADVREGSGNRGCFLTNTALELAPHDPEVASIVASAQTRMEAFLARMIEKGQARGVIPHHVRKHETARSLLASLLGLVVLARSRPEKALLQTVVDEAMRRLD